MTNMWDQRYDTPEYGYGTEPNDFFKQFIDNTPPGKILLPAEGEGRNAVYAASKGWTVHAFDFSTVGREKALKLAADKGVEIEYWISDITTIKLEQKYDAIALIYSHLHESQRNKVHNTLIKALNVGGYLVVESFSKDQLQYGTGGPKKIEMLYSMDDLKNDFQSLNIISLEKVEIQLNAGRFHKGKGSVIRLLAQSNSV